MFLLKLVLDDGSVEESFEGVEQLELSNDGVAVVEALGEDGGESSLEFLDSLSELEEVVVELSLLNIHDVVVDLGKIFHGLVELN